VPKILTGFAPAPGSPPDPKFRFRAALPAVGDDGLIVQRTYIFDVYWVERDGAWYFDLLLADETRVASGVKIVLSALLAGRRVGRDVPAGVMIASDLSGAGAEATLDDLGTRVLVYFFADIDT
jgi:hypothetical protein